MTKYAGRHRPPTRAERRRLEGRRLPISLSPGYAVPTAAAATLVLSAVGATAAQSSPFPADTSKAAARINPLGDPIVTEKSRSEAANAVADYNALSERRSDYTRATAETQGRDQQRAARSKARAELAAKKAAEKKQKEEREGKAWVFPLASQVSPGSPFGMRKHPVTGVTRLHAGVDFSVPVGTPLRAMSQGTVTFAGAQSGYGNLVEIEYWDGTVSRYGHMNSVSVAVGQVVSSGDPVGQSGNTGMSTGPHLHLEIHPGGGAPIDPIPWMANHGMLG
ncbi:M23 family metallopeptidase [Janibacter sp. GXQ6167]|uniref:M23 family metallopeptidase n=1 Tax=Janibacter sp. GXQ6167 TaxID=3240791 RepID=UPI0035261BF8